MRRSFRPNFSVHPVGKTMLDQKMTGIDFDGLNVLYHLAKFGEDRTTRAGCRCENMVFVCFLFVLSSSKAGTLFVRTCMTNYALRTGECYD